MYILGINGDAVSMEDRSSLKICYTGYDSGYAQSQPMEMVTTVSFIGDQILFMKIIVSGIDSTD